MPDLTRPSGRPARPDRVPAGDGASLTLGPSAPLRPDAGSPLDRLLRRQTLTPRAGGLLGFVPAQVR